MSYELCSVERTVSRVLVEECQRKATFLNHKNEKFVVTKVDGCLIKNAIAADYVVSRQGVGDVIVELKGRDVDHAVKQIEATARHWISESLGAGRMAGLVVCRQFPKASASVQKIQQRFTRAFGGPLHVVTKNCEYEFAHVLSHSGPLKA
jgi:hypothetical protein